MVVKVCDVQDLEIAKLDSPDLFMSFFFKYSMCSISETKLSPSAVMPYLALQTANENTIAAVHHLLKGLWRFLLHRPDDAFCLGPQSTELPFWWHLVPNSRLHCKWEMGE